VLEEPPAVGVWETVQETMIKAATITRSLRADHLAHSQFLIEFTVVQQRAIRSTACMGLVPSLCSCSVAAHRACAMLVWVCLFARSSCQFDLRLSQLRAS
jgi:hypothetical protein